MREDLLLLLKKFFSFYALKAFQKLPESASHLKKGIRELISIFKKCERIPEYIQRLIGKRAQKIREKIQPMEKRNQPDDARAFFENSNEIH